MDKEARKRIVIFYIIMSVSIILSVAFSLKVGFDYKEYLDYQVKLAKESGFYIDGGDFTPLVNTGKEFVFRMRQSVAEIVCESILILSTLAMFVPFGFAALKKNKNVCKKECVIYSVSSGVFFVIPVIICYFCTMRSSFGTALWFCATYTINAGLFAVLRGWLILREESKKLSLDENNN